MDGHQGQPNALAAELSDLRSALSGLAFPARQEDVLVELVTRHAPARLVRRAGALSGTRLYRSVDDLCDDVARSQGPTPPPWV